MDAKRIELALDGGLELFDLTVAERLALAHEFVAASTVARSDDAEDDFVPPRAFLVPARLERMYRGPAL